MIELKGKYSSLIAYLEDLEPSAMAQLMDLLNQPFTEGSRIRIMPDAHAGAGCVIGTTMTITDKIVPNLVGVDIGCGVLCMKLGVKDIPLHELDCIIRSYIPVGSQVRETEDDEFDLTGLRCYSRLRDVSRLKRSLGSLGSGNHFIELSRDDKGDLYLLVHSGSRNLGKQIAEIYQDKAYAALTDTAKERGELIARLKNEGRDNEIEGVLKSLKKPKVSREFAYVEGADFRDYLHDMGFAQHWAARNRQKIASDILQPMCIRGVGTDTVHNYIDHSSMILRKGAISAQCGEIVTIPLNMKDGTLLCTGKGNPDWNYSAPHGAGRIMSRAQAKANISLEEFTQSMKGIFSTTVNKSTLDEAPAAYKPPEAILGQIDQTVEILSILTPVYNFKASE